MHIIVNAPSFECLCQEIRLCTHCQNVPSPLPVSPRPIIRGSSTSKIRIIGQAPGTRVHASGIPFDDPSGDRLRAWLGVSKAEFYNEDLITITPMVFCFPGLDKKGSDLPPRTECAPLWQEKVTQALPQIELTLLIGMYAQKHYLRPAPYKTLTETVQNWEEFGPGIIPLPHPSWRNNIWIKKNPWFSEVIAHLRKRVQAFL